jgi:trimethylamine---corrinoid protein Co-methyltransferase
MAQKGFTRQYPPLKILSKEQVNTIKRASLDVLENVGIRFDSDKALEIFDANDCKVDHHQKIVKIPPYLVENALWKSPSSFRLKSRDPKDDLIIGGDTVYFEASVGLGYIDLDTLETRPPTLEENDNGVKVLDSLENIHCLLSYCPYMSIEGVAPAMQLNVSTASRLRYSTKLSRTGHLAGSETFAIKMAKAANMDLTISMESTAPLNWSADAIHSAFSACEADLPVRVTNGDVLGATGPATLAGGLVTGIAEVMSGIVLVNLIKPGAKVEANNFVFPMEMRSGMPDLNSFTSQLHSAAFSQVFREYDLPVVLATGQFGLGKNIGFQIGTETAFSLLATALAGANLINVGGGLHAELSWSPELAVLEDDLAGAVGHFLQGINIDDERIGLDVIKDVGSSPGTYLSNAHTRKYWEKEFFRPKYYDKLPYKEWVAKGKKVEVDIAKDRVREILKTHEVSVPLTKEQDKEIDQILEEANRHYREKGLL